MVAGLETTVLTSTVPLKVPLERQSSCRVMLGVPTVILTLDFKEESHLPLRV